MRKISAVLLAGALVTGCADSEAMKGESSGEVRSISSIDEIRLPLDAYQPEHQKIVTFLRAQELLERDCLKRFGINRVPRSDAYYETLAASASPSLSLWLGVTSEELAGRDGYGVDPVEVLVQEDSGAPPAEQRDVLEGRIAEYSGQPVPERGCTGEAVDRLGLTGTSVAPTSVDNLGEGSLRTLANTSARSDPQMEKLNKAWNDCMNEAGYEDLRAPGPRYQRSLGESISTKEQQMALADVKCKNKLNYMGVWSAVQGRYEQQLVDKNFEVLEQRKKVVDDQIRRATQILGTGS
ncbi:hypothetical protein [Actinocorallia populi]|uniref:hypothetical protein n=1 Tax=Actinocorallia populi TaxID=2079200 RepID=UPI0013008156|nr:hypothetical protein [Actinocorallia populi]